MYKNLVKYQETDSKLKAIEQEIGGSEERKKTAVAKKFLDTVSESVQAFDKRAKELAFAYENLSKKRAELSDAANEFESAILTCEDESEIAYLHKKADELLQRANAFESEINLLVNEMNGILSQYAQLKRKTKEAKEQYTEYGAKYTELKKSKEAEMNAIKAELAELEKSVAPDLMEKYKVKRKDKMFPILYEVNDKLCSHCRMELSMAELNKINSGEIIECDNCRCLIYRSK